MKKDIKKGCEEWGIFMDVFDLYKSYGTPEKEDAYWDSLLDAVEGYVKKHGGHPLAVNMGLAVADALSGKKSLNEKLLTRLKYAAKDDREFAVKMVDVANEVSRGWKQ